MRIQAVEHRSHVHETGFGIGDPFSWDNRPVWSPVQRQEEELHGETCPTGDVCAILATGFDTQSGGCDPGPECSGRAWPSRATNAPGIRGGIGQTALLLGGF